MRANRFINWVSIVSLISVIIFFIIELAIKDDLFFSSDVYSATIYASGIILLFTTFLCIASLPLFLYTSTKGYALINYLYFSAGILLVALFGYTLFTITGFGFHASYFYTLFSQPAVLVITLLYGFSCRIYFKKTYLRFRRVIIIVVFVLIALFFLCLSLSKLFEQVSEPQNSSLYGFLAVSQIFLIEYIATFTFIAALFTLSNSKLLEKLVRNIKNKDYTDYFSRIQFLGYMSFYTCSTITIFSLTYAHGIRPYLSTNSIDNEKHSVLIVLDAFPTYKLNIFNPNSPHTKLDDFFSQGLLFSNVHTATPWTNAWVGSLHKGDTTTAFNSSELRFSNNLLRTLQNAGIACRWIVFHRNAIPEASSARISDYSGLRSVLLGNGYTWLPELLGLNYHLTLSGSSLSSVTNHNELRKFLYEYLNNWKSSNDNIFLDALLPQLKTIQKYNNKTFTIFHVHSALNKSNPIAAWETQNNSNYSVDKQIRENNYRYDPENSVHIKYVKNANNFLDSQISNLGDKMTEFYQAISREPELENTTIFVTADHGTIYNKTRVWYGFHPNEEVLKIPFVIVNGKIKGKDYRLFSSIDIPETILDFYSIERPLNRYTFSMLSNLNRSHTTSITLNAQNNHEWYLVINKKNTRYLFNISPQSDGHWEKYTYSNYNETLIETGKNIPKPLVDIVKASLNRFNIGNKIHPYYRHYLNDVTKNY